MDVAGSAEKLIPEGRLDAVRLRFTGCAANDLDARVWTELTIDDSRPVVDCVELKTSGTPLLSTAPVRFPSAVKNGLGAVEGPGYEVGSAPGPMLMTWMPRLFRAVTASWTVAPPRGTTAGCGPVPIEPTVVLT